MKKFYLLIIAVALSGYMFGQQRVVETMGNKVDAKVIKELVSATKTPTDTLVPYGIANASSYLVSPYPNGGYIAGVNYFGDLAKAQQFPVTNGYNIEGFLVWVGAKEIVNDPDTVYANLYAMDGSGTSSNGTTAAPGTVVDMVKLAMDTDIDTTGGFSVAMFATPHMVWNDYAVGLDFSNMPDDTLGIVHSDDGDPQANTEFAWEQWSDNAWYTFNAATSWGVRIDMAFLPVIDNSTSDINEHDFVNGIRMENFPNPAEDVVNIEYEINVNADVAIKVLDMTGRIVKTVDLGNKTAGQYKTRISTNGMDAGMYFYMLEADGKRLAKRMMIK